MPYIKPEQRKDLDADIDQLSMRIISNGELNYCITRLALKYLHRLGLKYDNIASVIGTLSLIPVEISRRVVNGYEDIKIKENGDLPEYQSEFWSW